MATAPLCDTVYAHLLSYIAAQGLAPHSRLPGENQLATQCGVSRPVVRQALTRLRAEGHVYARHGAGNFVAEPTALRSVTFGSLQSIPDVQRFLDFRCMLEGESAARAAQCKDRALLHAITAKRRLLEASMARGEPAIEEDIAFHRAIAQATDNRFFVLTLAALEDQTRSAIRLIRELSPQSKTTRASDIRAEHRAIDAAIADGNPEAARAAMNSHLTGGMARLFGV